MFDHSFPACIFFFFFFEVEINLCTLIPLFRPGSIRSGSVSWDDCCWMFPDKLLVSLFPNRFPHYALTEAELPYSDFVGSRVLVRSCVTCHLHFWQNDWGLLHATVVTIGVEQTQNESQHTKLTLDKKIIWPLLPEFELATFPSWVIIYMITCISRRQLYSHSISWKQRQMFYAFGLYHQLAV